MRIVNRIYFILLIAFICFSCAKNEVENLELEANYFYENNVSPIKIDSFTAMKGSTSWVKIWFSFNENLKDTANIKAIMVNRNKTDYREISGDVSVFTDINVGWYGTYKYKLALMDTMNRVSVYTNEVAIKVE